MSCERRVESLALNPRVNAMLRGNKLQTGDTLLVGLRAGGGEAYSHYPRVLTRGFVVGPAASVNGKTDNIIRLKNKIQIKTSPC